jgi:subtilisin family serine protease
MLYKFLIIFILSLVGIYDSPKHNGCDPIKIAIIDTGLDLSDPRFKDHLCALGHKNFVPKESINDINGHGTHVAGLIKQYAGNSNYCILIYKYYTELSSNKDNLDREVLSIEEASLNGADVINISSSGPGFNLLEFLAIRSNPKIVFVVAAGNDGEDLDASGNESYPASYWLSNERVVESLDKDNKLMLSSNYSVRTQYKELGLDVLSLLPNNKIGIMSGTSMSTAIFSGKLIKRMSNSCRYKE